MDRRLDFDKIYGIKEGRLCVGEECWDEEQQAFESHGSGVTWVFGVEQGDLLKGGNEGVFKNSTRPSSGGGG
jgi:hypothetical protein